MHTDVDFIVIGKPHKKLSTDCKKVKNHNTQVGANLALEYY